jgi:hypothetical protein
MMLAKKRRASIGTFWLTQGLPHRIAITLTGVSDRQGALKTIEQNLEGLAEVTALLVDGGL